MRRNIANCLLALCVVSFCAGVAAAQETKDAKAPQAIQPAEVKLGRPVDFERDVYPILDAKCVACHNVAINENGLNLEDVKNILKGGKRGPSVVAKDPDKSLLFKLASRGAQPAMPPLPNKVEAMALTPQELGILKQWIVEGANVGMGGTGNVINWQPLPKGIHPIYAVAITPDGQFAAAGRGNKVVIYHVPTGDVVADLTDPSLLAIQHAGKPMYEAGSTHRDFVHSLAFSANGNMLASGSYREVKLWTRPENVQRLNLAASTGAVPAVAVSPDNKWIAAAGADNTIKLFNNGDGQPVRALAGHAAVVSGLQFSADSLKLYSSSHDKSIRVWNVADGAGLGRIDVPAAVNGVALSGDATKLAAACADNLIRVFAVPAPATQLAAPAAPVPAIRVSPDKKLLALAEADGKITLIDLATGKPLKQLAGHAAAVTSLAFSANSARLVSGSADKSVRVWDVAAGTQILSLTGTSQAVNAVALHPNGLQAVSGTADGQIALWKLDAPDVRAFPGDNGSPPTVSAVSLDGKQLATDGVADGKPVVFIRDVASGNVTKALVGHEAAITSLGFSQDNTKVISGSADKTARVWNLADGKELAKFAVHTNTVTAVGLNSNGTQAVSGAADNSLKVWNVADAKEIANCAGHTGVVSAAVIAANNQTVVSASADQSIRLWNLTNGQQAATFTFGQLVTSLAITSDGTKIAATGADANVRVFQLDGKLLLTLAGHAAAPKSVAFSADNLRLVSAGADNLAFVWDAVGGLPLESIPVAKGLAFARFAVPNNTLVVGAADKSIGAYTLHFERVLVGNTKNISGLAYSPAGEAVYSSSEDGTVRRYQTADGAQNWVQNHGAAIHDLAISPDGNLLATAGENNQVRIWAAANGGGGPQPTLAGFAAPVKSVAFSLDNAHLASGTANNLVFVHDIKTGVIEQIDATHAGSVEALAAAGETGKLFVTSSVDKSVRTFSLVFEKQIAGHGAPVTSIAFVPPQSARILSGSDDATVRVWELAAGNQVAALGHGGPVTSVAVSSDGLRYASASSNNTAKLWNAADNKQLAEMKGDLRNQKIVAELTTDDAESKAAITVAMNAIPAAEKVVVEKTEAQKKATEAKVAAEKVAVEMAGKAKVALDAKVVADKLAVDTAATAKVAADAKVVADKKVVDTTAAAKVAADAKIVADKLMVDTAAVAKAAVDAMVITDKAAVDTAAAAKAAVDAAAKAKEALDKDVNNETLKKAKADADALVVKTADDAKKAVDAKAVADKKVVDTAAEAKKAADAKVITDKAAVDTAAAAKVAADAKVITDKTAVDTAAVAKTAADAKVVTDKASADTAAAAKKADDDKVSATKGLEQADRAVKESTDAVAKAKTDHEAAVNKQKVVETALTAAKTAATEREKPIRAIRFSRDGKELAFAGDSASVSTFDGLTGVAWAILDGHKAPVLALEYGAGRSLVSGAADQTAKSWDLNPGWTLAGVLGPKKEAPQDLNDSLFVSRVLCLDFSPDGKLLATGGGDPSRSGEVMLWDVATRTVVKNLEQAHSDTVFGIKFSRDGQFLLSGAADKFVKIHSIADGKLVRSFEGHTNHVLGVSWKADGKFVASAGGDNAIKIWNVETGEQARTIGGYAKQVTCIQYMGRGPNIVSCGGDKTVRFHLADNGNNYRNFAGATDFMFAAAASQNELVVVAGGQAGVLRLWNGANGQVLRTVEPPKAEAANQQAQAK